MAALTAKRLTESRNAGNPIKYKMADNVTIYAGGLVMINSSGLAQAAAASASNNGCVGVAAETVTNPSGGTKDIEVLEGEFKFAAASVAQANVGEIMYASDDQTVDETQGANEPRAGIMTEFISTTSCWLRVSLATAS